MAINTIYIYTATAENILKEIDSFISKPDKEKKTFINWSKDVNGYFHTGDGDQWKDQARLTFSIEEYTADDGVTKKKRIKGTAIMRPKATKPESDVFGVYLGRFSHMLIAHMQPAITRISLI